MTMQLDWTAGKDRQRQTWEAGDYRAVGAKIVGVAEALVEELDPDAGIRVLDVATGTGNAALAAARTGCAVTALDLAPRLLEHAAARAAAEGVELALVEGDAEALPFADGTFDAVLSVFGVMFAPDQRRAASELARVCRPGGSIALASWTPEGAVGDFFRVVAAYAPPPGGTPPTRWGTEDGLARLFGDALTDLRLTRRTCTLRSPSPEAFADFYLTQFGPAKVAAAGLEPPARDEFRRDLADLAAAHLRDSGTVSVRAEYLEATGRRT